LEAGLAKENSLSGWNLLKVVITAFGISATTISGSSLPKLENFLYAVWLGPCIK